MCFTGPSVSVLELATELEASLQLIERQHLAAA